MVDIAIIGGGAAGFFAAINLKIKHPSKRVLILEKTKTVLGKVRISGGGRCNVTHACFSPKDLIAFYPRGSKELLSIFNQFAPLDTIQWFKEKGVELKTESDGRMFPTTDNSETIVNCFLNECEKHQIQIKTNYPVQTIEKCNDGFLIHGETDTISAKQIVIATGSSNYFWQMLKTFGHTLIAPVPSLFTFNIQHPMIQQLQGVAIPNVSVKLQIEKTLIKKLGLNAASLEQKGALLFTHWGLSGPAILKLSAVGARLLNHQNYEFEIALNFCDEAKEETVLNVLNEQKKLNPKKQVSTTALYNLPNRFWQSLVQSAISNETVTWADISKKDLQQLCLALTAFQLNVKGKSTFKDEFVTAGGIDLKEIDFKTMQSKLVPGLYFAGEVLNIDALTGGFNFQAAWSEAWVLAEHMAD